MLGKITEELTRSVDVDGVNGSGKRHRGPDSSIFLEEPEGFLHDVILSSKITFAFPRSPAIFWQEWRSLKTTVVGIVWQLVVVKKDFLEVVGVVEVLI
mmetsp:Transcript_13123/g.21756  ORF Transcript_13123/g.21756 Transcript_13123/m.21756 type:complete len:98 (-) Transcript_13123:58-351(-)